MKKLLLVIALCTICAAFNAREPRALNEEEAPSSSTESQIICAPETPCAWIPYNPVSRINGDQIDNNYCICDVNKACKALQDDRARGVFTLYCRDPEYDDTDLLNS